MCRQHTSVHAHGCTVRMLRRVHNLPVPYTKGLHLCLCGFQVQPLHSRQRTHIHWDGHGHSVSSSDTPCILWSIPRGTYLFQVSLFGSHVSWRKTHSARCVMLVYVREAWEPRGFILGAIDCSCTLKATNDFSINWAVGETNEVCSATSVCIISTAHKSYQKMKKRQSLELASAFISVLKSLIVFF